MKNAPPLRDDCFAMPRGVSWTPVEEALVHRNLLVVESSAFARIKQGGLHRCPDYPHLHLRRQAHTGELLVHAPPDLPRALRPLSCVSAPRAIRAQPSAE